MSILKLVIYTLGVAAFSAGVAFALVMCWAAWRDTE